MRTFSIVVLCCALLLLSGAQNPPAAGGAAQIGPNSGLTLESVLTRMDQTAAAFKNAQADFVWDQYEEIVKVHDRQSGTIYFRRGKKGLEMAADIQKPTPKRVVYSGDQVKLYEPKIDQMTVYNTAKNKAEFESFIVLGFGGRGHDLQKKFTVSLVGTENIGSVRAAELKLIPTEEKARNVFKEIYLWIDPAQGLSVRQKFIEPSDNYRDATYTNIRLNKGVPDDAFKLPKAAHTVTPQQ
jgi:outer membrane lipoprotein-sorting protein